MRIQFVKLVPLLIRFLYLLLGLSAIISVALQFFWWYPFELLSHFRVYYLLGAAVLALGFCVCKLQRLTTAFPFWLSLGLVVFNSAWVIPWYWPQAQLGAGTTLRVLAFNINVQNDHWAAIAEAIQAVEPDIATVIESSNIAQQELEKRLTKLPFVYRASGGGLTIFSRLPLISPASKTYPSGTILITSLQVQQKKVELIAAHPLVPVKPELFQRRNALLAEITTLIQQRQRPLIFLGDLNLTPWSPYYSRLVNRTGLHNTRLGFGIEPSWIEPATHVHLPGWVTTAVKIPIDHIFVSPDFRVADCQTKAAANSDHRLLWSDLVLRG